MDNFVMLMVGNIFGNWDKYVHIIIYKIHVIWNYAIFCDLLNVQLSAFKYKDKYNDERLYNSDELGYNYSF